MKLTKSNIAYDLNISPHKTTVVYDSEVITYYFSSNFYKTIFLEKIENNRKYYADSLSHRFGFSVGHDLLFDLKLYKEVEKRGFLIIKGGEKYQCLNDIILNGGRMMKKN